MHSWTRGKGSTRCEAALPHGLELTLPATPDAPHSNSFARKLVLYLDSAAAAIVLPLSICLASCCDLSYSQIY